MTGVRGFTLRSKLVLRSYRYNLIWTIPAKGHACFTFPLLLPCPRTSLGQGGLVLTPCFVDARFVVVRLPLFMAPASMLHRRGA